MQSIQAARQQTDDKYKIALQKLAKDEYNLVNLVTRFNDFDPVEHVANFVDGTVLSNDVISPEYHAGGSAYC